MDLKTIELEILKVNEEFIKYLDINSQESKEKIKLVFQDLTKKADEKSTFIKSLEEKVVEKDEQLKLKISNLLTELSNVLDEKKEDKFNLEATKIELNKQKEEELKPYLLQHKKKKTETTHKISAQKKELSFLLKENKNKLILEEKNFKNREIELTRRLDIDLERLNDSNIKEYSDIEKSILDMEDEKLIREAQRKINSIRLVGIKEMLAIKNKYAVLNYENIISFKKFEEKVSLDNSVLTEEFKQRIRNLEYEKKVLELEEDLKLTLEEFNKELKMLEFGKENKIDYYEFETERLNKKLNIQTQINKSTLDQFALNQQDLININQEINQFDLNQIKELTTLNHEIYLKQRQTTENLLESLRGYLESFKNLMLINYDNYLINRNETLNRFVSVMSNSKFTIFFCSNSSFDDVTNSLENVIEEYLKQLTKLQNQFINIIKDLVKGFENHLKLVLTSLKTFWKENDSINNQFYNNLINTLETEIRSNDNNLKIFISNESSKVNKKFENENLEYENELNIIKDKTEKLLLEFNINKKEINQKAENYKREIKVILEKEKKELNKFVKQSKQKISNYKKIYNYNLTNHEKVEYKIYRNNLKQNKLEFKNRKESME